MTQRDPLLHPTEPTVRYREDDGLWAAWLVRPDGYPIVGSRRLAHTPDEAIALARNVQHNGLTAQRDRA